MEFTATIEEGIKAELKHEIATQLVIINKFKLDVATDKSSPTHIISWAGSVISSEFIYREALKTLGRVNQGKCDLAASVTETMEDLEDGLLGNSWRPSSTNPLDNAVEIQKADAASRAFRAYQFWAKGLTFFGKF